MKPRMRKTNVSSFDETRQALDVADKYLSVCTVSDANVSSPPTDAELDATLGTPAQVANGFHAIVDDAGAGSAAYLVAAKGGFWGYVALTKAV